MKRVFHKLETYGGQCLQIPVFTGMTGYGDVLRVDGKNDVANRRAVYGPTLEWRLLKQALETRPYNMDGMAAKPKRIGISNIESRDQEAVDAYDR